jgi:uncharacterized protein (TIGR00255 family)
MIYSMTGFGRGEASAEGITILAEARSVNNRFFDFNYRSSRSLQNFENELRDICRSHIHRGKLTLSLSESRGPESSAVRFDKGAAQKLTTELQTLANELGLQSGVGLEHLLQFSDMLIPVEAVSLHELLIDLCRKATEGAMTSLRQMRKTEGHNLSMDMLERLKEIERRLTEIDGLQDGLPQRALDKLRDRVKRLTVPEAYDEYRLEMELAFMADRLDITEEIVRLRGHINAFRKTLESPSGAVGKRLEFLLQEMNRETNTIGSKTSNIEISHHSVGMKEEIERIREQVQNIE